MILHNSASLEALPWKPAIQVVMETRPSHLLAFASPFNL